MVEEDKNLDIIEEKEAKPIKKIKTFKADYKASVYAFFHFTSPTGTRVGSLEVNSKTGDYELDGQNFNWGELEKVFKETVNSEMIKDLVVNPQSLRIPVGEQFAEQKIIIRLKS